MIALHQNVANCQNTLYTEYLRDAYVGYGRKNSVGNHSSNVSDFENQANS